MPMISKERFNKDRKFCKSSKCLDSHAILVRRVAKEELLFILSLLKSLISLNLESTDTGCSESLKRISMELQSVKYEFRFSSSTMLVSLEEKEINKVRIY